MLIYVYSKALRFGLDFTYVEQEGILKRVRIFLSSQNIMCFCDFVDTYIHKHEKKIYWKSIMCHTAILLKYVNKRDTDSFYNTLSKRLFLEFFFSHSSFSSISSLALWIVLNCSIFLDKQYKIMVSRNIIFSDISPFTFLFLERSENKLMEKKRMKTSITFLFK